MLIVRQLCNLRACDIEVFVIYLMQETSFQYWPDGVSELVEFGEYTVDMISEETLTGFTIRTLSLLHKKV